MDVEDGLAGGLAGVEDDAVAGFGDAFGFGHPAGEVGEFVEEAVAGLGDGGQVAVMVFGYSEYMGGCLRVNIPERQGTGTFENVCRRYLAGHNLAEKTVVHRRNLNVRLIPGYCLRSVAPAAPAPRALSRRRRTVQPIAAQVVRAVRVSGNQAGAAAVGGLSRGGQLSAEGWGGARTRHRAGEIYGRR